MFLEYILLQRRETFSYKNKWNLDWKIILWEISKNSVDNVAWAFFGMGDPRDPGPDPENTGDFRKILIPGILEKNPENPENPGIGIENFAGIQKIPKIPKK